MSVVVNSLNTVQSSTVTSTKSTLFCCCTKESDESSVEIKNTIESLKETEVKEKLLYEEPEKPEDEVVECDIPTIIVNDKNTKQITEEKDKLTGTEIKSQVMLVSEGNEAEKTAEIQLKIGMDSDKTSLIMTIIDALDFDRSTISSNSVDKVLSIAAYSVHILVLPLKKLRFKTTLRKGPDPYFDEVIKIPKLKMDLIKNWNLRFRLYGTMRNSSEEILGEGYLFIDTIDLEMRTQCKIALMKYRSKIPETVVNTMISCSKCNYEEMASLANKIKLADETKCSEVLIGLSYNFTICRLSLEVIKGFNFPKYTEDKGPDTLINIVIKSGKGEEMTTLKTVIKKGTLAPIFEETFIFKIQFDLLEGITLTLSGCHKSQGKLIPFGHFVMGKSNSTEEDAKHWNGLMASKCGDQLIQWHKLQPAEET